MKKLTPQLFLSLKSYSKENFVKDIIAGLIVAIIALPLSIALALASGVSPEQGLYTAIVAGFIISAIGGSKVQIAGPTAAFATIVAGIVAKNGIEGLAVATIIAGIMLIAMGILRLGNMIKYIPYTITAGFTAGIAVTIVIGQLKDFMGIKFQNSPIETMDKLREVFSCITTVNLQAIFVGCLALAILIICPKFLKKVPSSVIAVIVTAALVRLAHLSVNTIGDLYTISSAPPSFNFPSFSFDTVKAVLPDAFTIAVLAAIESLLSCVVADEMIGSKHNSNMELIAQGVGNSASALFGGIPATGAIARTAANIKNGGTSPVSGMIHSVVLLAILVVLMPYAALIPMPCIAAILFQVAYNMSGIKNVVRVVRGAPLNDVAVLVVTFALTVVFDLVVAIIAGLLLAFILFIKQMSDVSDVKELSFDNELSLSKNNTVKIPENVSVFEFTGPLFFGSADKMPKADMISGKNVIVLNMKSVPSVDITALNKLRSFCKECSKKEIRVIMSNVNEQPMAAIKKSGLFKEVGEECFRPDIYSALEASYAVNEKEVYTHVKSANG